MPNIPVKFLQWAAEDGCGIGPDEELNEDGTFKDSSEVFTRNDLLAAFEAGMVAARD